MALGVQSKEVIFWVYLGCRWHFFHPAFRAEIKMVHFWLCHCFGGGGGEALPACLYVKQRFTPA